MVRRAERTHRQTGGNVSMSWLWPTSEERAELGRAGVSTRAQQLLCEMIDYLDLYYALFLAKFVEYSLLSSSIFINGISHDVMWHHVDIKVNSVATRVDGDALNNCIKQYSSRI